LYVIHDLKALAVDPRAEGLAAVISGHSHQPRSVRRAGVLYFNPGSAGPRRFRLPVSLGMLRVSRGTVVGRLRRLSPEGPRRGGAAGGAWTGVQPGEVRPHRPDRPLQFFARRLRATRAGQVAGWRLCA